jgi:hypothetical protein
MGVLADEKSGMLWVCSNDVSALGVPGPGSEKGSALKGFDLKTGAGKVSVKFPGTHTFCNDMAVGDDGAVYVTNSFAPQILRLRPGAHELEIWHTDAHRRRASALTALLSAATETYMLTRSPKRNSSAST